jgi:hypothetical protein
MTETEHWLPLMLSQPVQFVNELPASGTAVRVTDSPAAKLALQALPQLIRSGRLVILPLPAPLLLTVSVPREPDLLLRTGQT